MTTTYPSNLSNAEWDNLQRFLPPRSLCGRLRWHSLRSVFDALFYLLRTGCPWRYLPSNFPPWQTVYYQWRQFCRTGLWTRIYRALREAERLRAGRDPNPSAAILDAQRVETVEETGRICGYDAHKRVKGRKRHLLEDTLRRFGPTKAYQGQNLADWCRATGDWKLEVVKRSPGERGRSQQPNRWIMERKLA